MHELKKIGLLWRTVRHLTPRQVLYQLINRLRGRAQLRLPKTAPAGHFLVVPDAEKPVSWQQGVFTFLNQSVDFDNPGLKRQRTTAGVIDDLGNLYLSRATNEKQTSPLYQLPQIKIWGYRINWNYPDLGKLWTYNLNYFDFLNQPGVSPEAGLRLIFDFIAQTDSLEDGLEPYPTSLRITNWIQFLSRHKIQNKAINAHLYAQIDLLRWRLEYHLAGNHLLENGFALLTSALYFRHRIWFQLAATLIRDELTTQVLADGGHDERSPVYHQILLDRLLDGLLALRHDARYADPQLADYLTEKATQMLGWLDALTFRNGDVPLVNDAAPGIAPVLAQLRVKAGRLGLTVPTVQQGRSLGNERPTTPTSAGEISGYRMFRQNRYELFADVGPVGPAHQPGHAHADTFSFVLHVDNEPIVVDSGTSTYQIGARRAWERSTAAHNTVEVGGRSSSEVWRGFRVGRRAGVTVLTDTETELTARHDGYRSFGVIHERTWTVEPTKLCIFDRLISIQGATDPAQLGIARFHVHPDVRVVIGEDVVIVGAVRLTFASDSAPELRLADYEMASGFNQLRPGQCLEVTFRGELTTTIRFAK